MCLDGILFMTVKHKAIVTLAKNKNPTIITIHCFIHREVLVEKTLEEKMLNVLYDVVKINNYIKCQPLKTRIFGTICEEIGSDHVQLMLHEEVKWLSRSLVLNRVIELKNELKLFFEQGYLLIFKDLFIFTR